MFSISFSYNDENINFESDGVLSLYNDLLDWLDKKGYNFQGPIHNAFVRKVYNEVELNQLLSSKKYLKRNMFYNINNSGKYIQITEGNIGYRLRYMLDMLSNFGIDVNTIKTKGFESGSRFSSRIKKFGDIDDVELDELEEPIETEIENTESIEKIKIFEKNPFRQSLCVVGEPGAGKSQTMLNILQEEGHKTLLFIPTELSTSMVVQYSEGKLRLNRLGNFIVKAYEYPDILFTVLIDEFHKPMTIKRVNDELLQAISTSRYSGNRFLTLEVAEELMEEKLKSLGISEEDYLYHSNIRIPNNLGFVLLTSKPSVIVDNKDIYDRVNITEIKKEYYDESTGESMIKKLSDLDNIILKSKQEKDQFKKELKSRDI